VRRDRHDCDDDACLDEVGNGDHNKPGDDCADRHW
jgi:hypothetical protein